MSPSDPAPVPRPVRALIVEVAAAAAGLRAAATDPGAAAYELARIRDLADGALRLLVVPEEAPRPPIVLCPGCGRTVTADGVGHHDRDCPAT